MSGDQPEVRQVFTANTFNFVAQDQTNNHPPSHFHGVTSRPTPALNVPRSSGGHVLDATRSNCVLLGRKSSSRLWPNVLSASMPDCSRCFRFWPPVYAIPIAFDFHLIISSYSRLRPGVTVRCSSKLQFFGSSQHPSTVANVHW